jgi:hypothetical protein
MALLFERTRRGREKVDRLEVRRVSGRPGDRGELVARIPLELPLRIPRRVREVLAAARSERVGGTSQRAA